MLNAYQDRGIIKWAAFDALIGFNSMLKEMKHKLGKIDKPILSEDDFENMNRVIKQAISDKLEVIITFYQDGYSKTTFGYIKKLDFNNKEIILTTRERVSAFDVLGVDLA